MTETLNNEEQVLNSELENLEVKILLEAIYSYYGFDFRNYSLPYIRRRIIYRLQAENLRTISGLQEKVLHDRQAMLTLFQDFSINVTEMFRDPEFFLALRQKVIPLLRERPQIRIWQAGCSTGEESYSLAILLHEEELLHKTRIYATDFNEFYLEKAKEGTFSIQRMQRYTRNYLNAGGEKAFSEYYSVNGEKVQFDRALTQNIVFAQHNLVTDTSFNEFDLIICRNVMIYFDKLLQSRVHDLLYGSLRYSGFLGLGNKEGLSFTSRAMCYKPVDPQEKIYQKIR